MPIIYATYLPTEPLQRPNFRDFDITSAFKSPKLIVISIPLIKRRRMRCLAHQKDEVHRAGYGRLCLLSLLPMYRRSPRSDRVFGDFDITSAYKSPSVIVISIPLIKRRRMRCLTHQNDGVYGPSTAAYGYFLCYPCTDEVPSATEFSEILTSQASSKPQV